MTVMLPYYKRTDITLVHVSFSKLSSLVVLCLQLLPHCILEGYA